MRKRKIALALLVLGVGLLAAPLFANIWFMGDVSGKETKVGLRGIDTDLIECPSGDIEPYMKCVREIASYFTSGKVSAERKRMDRYPLFGNAVFFGGIATIAMAFGLGLGAFTARRGTKKFAPWFFIWIVIYAFIAIMMVAQKPHHLPTAGLGMYLFMAACVALASGANILQREATYEDIQGTS